MAVSLSLSNSVPEGHVKSAFGPACDWPGMPLHQAVIPDGRIMAIGTDLPGRLGAALDHASLDPALGAAPNAPNVLDHVAQTDIFGATELLMPSSGEPLIVDDDRAVADGRRNNGVGAVVVSGGRDDATVKASGIEPAQAVTFAPTPVVYRPGIGWHSLPPATTPTAPWPAPGATRAPG